MPVIIHPRHSRLVLVDYQARLLPAIAGADAAVAEALRLADVAIELGIPVIGTEQNPQGLGPNVAAIRERCATTLSKMHFDACADGLLELLDGGSTSAVAASRRLPDVVIAGCEAHVCLLQTALGLIAAGHRVWVVGPACASRSHVDRDLALQRLQQAGAVIVSPEMVIFEWLATCEHERFRSVLKRLKTPPTTSPTTPPKERA